MMKIFTNYSSSVFWNQRFKEHGHTGYADRIIYEYDQPLRLRVIKKLTQELIGDVKNKKILDVGCGVGDFSLMFAKMGSDVTGIDISKEATEKARQNNKGFSCNFLVTSIMKMDLIPKSFDIILSITVLQHISDEELELSVQKMVDFLKLNGYIYLLETAPISLNQSIINSEYLYFRTRKEWITIFENAGMKLYFDTVYPSFGLFLIKLSNNMAQNLYRIITRKTLQINNIEKDQNILKNGNILFKIHDLIVKIILFFSKSVDYYMPFLSKVGTTRLLVFKKVMV
jgi:ubiquinone/menaquinone biosynthesis C-methylase UbiE